MAGKKSARREGQKLSVRIKRKHEVKKAEVALMKELSSRVKEHVSKTKGITNVFVDALASLLFFGSGHYLGVHSADQLHLLPTPKQGIVIVNQQTRAEFLENPTTSGHFVSIVLLPDRTLYFDPLALPKEFNPLIWQYLSRSLHGERRYGRDVLTEGHPMQDSKSTYCGLFATLFAKWADDHFNLGKSAPPLFFYTQTEDLPKNDELCTRYLKMLNEEKKDA